MDLIEVDGSLGEGGGQILRTAVSFSAIKRKPVRIFNIRARREAPGLKRQHLSALQVMANVFGGEMKGAREGSTEVSFVPRTPRMGSLSIDMGTAASITLVLQAVVPAVALSSSELTLDLVGGTDVPWSPTFDYFHDVVREAFGAIGIRFEVTSERRGYYPRGGGRVKAVVEPSESVRALHLVAPPRISGARIRSRCCRLPSHVSERQIYAASEYLGSAGIAVEERESSQGDSDSPGSSILIFYTGPGAFIGADGIGARGKRAEMVGIEAAKKFAGVIRSGACLDSHLADMVLPLLSLAGTPSKVRIPEVTPHLQSGLRLAEQFTGCEYSVEVEGRGSIVTIAPRRGQ